MVSVRFAQMSEFFCLIKAPLQIFRRYEILRNFDTIMNIAYLKKKEEEKIKISFATRFPNLTSKLATLANGTWKKCVYKYNDNYRVHLCIIDAI